MFHIGKITAIFLTAFLVTCTSVDKSVFIRDKVNLGKEVTVAVMPFKDAPGKDGSGVHLADALTGEMVKITSWSLVERSQLSRIMKEKTLDMTGVTDVDFADYGRLLKTDYLVLGSVSDFYYDRQYYIVPKTKVAFNARIIHVKTGTIVGTVRYSRETNKRAWLGAASDFTIYRSSFSQTRISTTM